MSSQREKPKLRPGAVPRLFEGLLEYILQRQAKKAFSLVKAAAKLYVELNMSDSRIFYALSTTPLNGQQLQRSAVRVGGTGTECPLADSGDLSGSFCPCMKLWPEFRDQKSVELGAILGVCAARLAVSTVYFKFPMVAASRVTRSSEGKVSQSLKCG